MGLILNLSVTTTIQVHNVCAIACSHTKFAVQKLLQFIPYCKKAVCNSATRSNTVTSHVHCMSPRLHSVFLLSLISYKYVCVLVSKEI